ncbi:AraC family transcriptional regulator [Streptomyces sp. ODS28]|uniref:AraC family transcriptional regulator n=1 Tax=Streptomyces sp. ODS28 TaxID=3136688 RepID=UPI0031ED6300
MDLLGELLGGGDGARARGGLFHQVLVSPPWAVRVEDGAPLALTAMLRGDGWLMPAGGAALRLAEGAVAVTRGPDPYVLADAPGTEPALVIGPGDCCMSPEGRDLCEELRLGVRSWGSRPATTLLLNGTYTPEGELSRPLLDALPPALVLSAGEWDASLLSVAAAEVVRDGPGQQVVLDRLLDLVLVAVLRAWFARPGATVPGWFRAQADPVVGPALRLLHEQPAHAWTVASLAASAGTSRTVLARRFRALTGRPPMAYLTSRRIDLAAQLLRDPATTLTSAARRVGYADAFTLSTAFKRVRGISPAEYREGTRSTRWG